MILAHDLGTTGDKASLYEDDGRLVASVTVDYPTHFASGGTAEQDPEQWWSAIGTGTRAVLSEAGAKPAEVRCVAFSAQMMGVVALDRRGRPVRPAVIWADTRAEAQAGALVERLGMDRIYEITGHRADATYSLPKMMWLKEHEPDVWARVARVAQAKDFVAYRLTGRLVTEPSDAAAMNAFDQLAGEWSEEMLSAAEISPEIFPEVVPSTTVIGGITEEAAPEVGLPAGTPVVIGGGDGPCAAVGAGVVSAGAGGYAYLGSSSWISVASDEPRRDAAKRVVTFSHVVPGEFLPTAVMQAAGASIDWLAELLAEAGADDPLGQMIRAASETDPDEADVIFLPYLMGERSPHWNPRLRGALIGLTRHHGLGVLVRSILDGVALNLRVGLDSFAAMGLAPSRLDVIGGGARSDLWLQILADAWGLTLRRRSLVSEANGLGAAVIGAVGIGLLDGFARAPELSEVQAVFEPDPSRRADYDRRYATFLETFQTVEPALERRGRPVS